MFENLLTKTCFYFFLTIWLKKIFKKEPAEVVRKLESWTWDIGSVILTIIPRFITMWSSEFYYTWATINGKNNKNMAGVYSWPWRQHRGLLTSRSLCTTTLDWLSRWKESFKSRHTASDCSACTLSN